MKTVVRTFFCCLILTAAVSAQTDRGTITGTVSDPAAAVVPGANVRVTNVESGGEYRTQTTGTGNYTLTSLPRGTYTLTVESPGFSRLVREGISVQVAQTVRVNVELQVGASSESVTVSADAPLLRTENAEQSINVSGDVVNALPINFGAGNNIRNWLSFVILSPGVEGTSASAPVNGFRGGYKIYLEGQDVTSVNDVNWTSTVQSGAVDTIGEFSVQTSNFKAEYGQALGAVFNFTTKSGGNQYHGSAFTYVANEAFDAARPFAGTKSLNRKFDYGGTIGGPVLIPKIYNGRNRTFFFFSLERYKNNSAPAGTFRNVPTAAYREGDFSAALTGVALGTDSQGRTIAENTIYDMRTDRLVNGVQVRDPFQNNQIPKSILDPVALKIQDLIPAPTNNELVQNWNALIPTDRTGTIPSVKVDHSFNDRTKISGYWSVQRTVHSSGDDGLPLPISGGRFKEVTGHISRINLDRTISPTMLMTLGAGYSRFHNPDSSPKSVLEYDAVGLLGLRASATDPAGFPYLQQLTVNNRGGMQGNMGPGTANDQFADKLNAVASLTYIKANHTLKFGGEFKQDAWTEYNYYGAQGQFTFGNNPTALPELQGSTIGGGAVGAGYASFLLGHVAQTNVNAVRDPQLRKKSWGFYAQDTWKLTRKLTLDVGLRYDLSGQGHEIHYRSSQIGLHTPNPAAGGLPGGYVYEGYGPGRCNCEFVRSYPYAIGPRLGIAYQVNDRTVVRAGWGVTYSAGSPWGYITGGAPALGLGWNSQTNSAQFGAVASRFQDGIDVDLAALYEPTLDPGVRPLPGQLATAPAWGPQMRDPNGGRPARVNQWNFAVQRELALNMSLEAAYVGNRGVWTNANGLVNLNAILPSTLAHYGLDLTKSADRTLLTSRIDSSLAASRGFVKPYSTFPNNGTVAQTLRPFPMYDNNLNVWWSPNGNSWYDSLQVKFNKRYSHGLDLQAAFTWSKYLETGRRVNNVFNRANQKTISPNSQPYTLVIGFSYETPQLTANEVVRQVFGGWTFGGVLRYASGNLMSTPGSRNNLNRYTRQASGTLFNRVPGEPLFLVDPSSEIDPNKQFVLNPDAWADAGPGEWGVSAAYFDDFRWKRNVNEELSVGRRFRFGERMWLQVRAEFFNAFNRMRLPTPSAFNPTQTQTFNSQGVPTGGYGYINANNTSGQRNGQIVARLEF